jgi:prophage regulatory protein
MKSLIRLAEVERRTSLSRSEIYKLMHKGAFPAAVRLGRRAVAWVEEEVDGFVERTSAKRITTPEGARQES